MVKNTTGGSGHKSQARKMVSGGKSTKIRCSENEFEQYAYVSKMLGNGMCYIMTESGTELMCHIRGKFRGRNKKQNVVSPMSIILIGIRDWESTQKNCDLLEVYDAEDVRQLHSMPGVNLTALDQRINSIQNSGTKSSNQALDDLVFSNSAIIEDEPVAYFDMDPSNNDGEDFVAFEDI